MGKELTPKLIVERHGLYPEGTANLIEYYANMKVYEHIRRLIRYSCTTMVNNGTIIIASEYENWCKFKDMDVFAGISIQELQKSESND